MPGTALRSLIFEVLKATDALDASTQLLDLSYTQAIDALIAGEIDVAVFPQDAIAIPLQRLLEAPGIRLMSVAQAEAIAKTVPGLKHAVMWRGLIDYAVTFPIPTLTCWPPATDCWCETIFTPPCNICCSKQCEKSTGRRAPSMLSENFLLSNPMICLSLQRHRHFTAQVRLCGSGTRPFGSPHYSIELHFLSFRLSWH